jgi:protein TonB
VSNLGQQRRIDMFETSVIRVQARSANRRVGLLTLSVVAHAAIIIAVVAAGLASVRLPTQAPMQMTYPVTPAPPPALGTPDAKPAQPKPQTPQPPQTQRVPAPQTLLAPNVIPATVPQVASSGTDTQNTGGGDHADTPGEPWGCAGCPATDGPPATAQQVVEPTGPLVAGVGEVKAPIVLKRVSPPYPPFAVKVHLNGFVIVECIIDKTGVVRDAKVVRSSSTMFDQAALDAVQQWQFSPGTLHGKPVDTIFDLTVTFTITR